MEQYTGRSVLNKIAAGKVFFYSRKAQEVRREEGKDPAAELARFCRAKEAAAGQLEELAGKAAQEVGESGAQIFAAHVTILKDEDFHACITEMIEKEKVNAEYAVAAAGEHYARMFARMEDEYFRAREADIRDITRRLLENLQEEEILTEEAAGGSLPVGEEPVILAAKDLSPSDTLRMDPARLAGIVTEQGSVASHTAILARTMGIPAILGVPVGADWNGRMAVLDGKEGLVILDPEVDVMEGYRRRQREESEERARLEKLKGAGDVTLDGKEIQLMANIGSARDIEEVLEQDGAGVGLFRSEYLYLGREESPSEEEQYLEYKSVLQKMQGKRVVIRTLDAGADKQAAYLGMAREENPALGCRGIRLCLERRELFRTQLRALLRASVWGNLEVMYPMIISVAEVQKIQEVLKEAREELTKEGIPWKDFPQGVMIETPAAVMISRELAAEVDFFSIGTNDLTQYTLAVDRQNGNLGAYYDPRHPAILRMIRMVVENGHAQGCRVGICGDLGSDPELMEVFVKMGVDELSVPPASILPLREVIRNSRAGAENS